VRPSGGHGDGALPDELLVGRPRGFMVNGHDAFATIEYDGSIQFAPN
jgi:hypothetical protein